MPRLRPGLLWVASTLLLICGVWPLVVFHRRDQPHSEADDVQALLSAVSSTTPERVTFRHVSRASQDSSVANASFVEEASLLHSKPHLQHLKVPVPILVVSLPKSGTTSIARYFTCGKIWTAHTFVNTPDQQQLRIGECFFRNVQANRSMLDNCGPYKVFTDNGFVRGKRCFYPSVHGLDAFYKAHPNATLLLIKRRKEAWTTSIQRWKSGTLVQKWASAKCAHFPSNKHTTAAELEDFYEAHAARIRQFHRDHPSLTLVEVQLEDNDVDVQLEAAIGIDRTCWGHHNSHEKRLALNPRFRAEWNRTQHKRQAEGGS